MEIKDGRLENEIAFQLSKKLDWLLLIFYDYFDYYFEIRERSESNTFGSIAKRTPSVSLDEYNERMLDKFFDLVDLFQKHLLITHQPRYVQFIFFYLCSYTEIYPDFMQNFLSRLINNIRNENEPRLIRVNSANYLRSMAIRARFVPFKIIQKTLEYLVNFLKQQTKTAKKKLLKETPLSKNAHKINLESSSTYRDKIGDSTNTEYESQLRELFLKFDILYYTNLTIAYLFSFKAQEFKKDETGTYEKFINVIKKYGEELHMLDFIPYSILSTLRDAHCIVSQDSEFLEMLDAKLNEDGTEGKKFKGSDLLEDYLPFDPHFLPHSRKVIESNYHFLSSEETVVDDDILLGIDPNQIGRAHV